VGKPRVQKLSKRGQRIHHREDTHHLLVLHHHGRTVQRK
jgi:hypothetical protein